MVISLSSEHQLSRARYSRETLYKMKTMIVLEENLDINMVVSLPFELDPSSDLNHRHAFTSPSPFLFISLLPVHKRTRQFLRRGILKFNLIFVVVLVHEFIKIVSYLREQSTCGFLKYYMTLNSTQNNTVHVKHLYILLGDM